MNEMPRPLRRKTAGNFDPCVLDLFDAYVDGSIAKREFIERAVECATAGVTGERLLEQLSPNYALARSLARQR